MKVKWTKTRSPQWFEVLYNPQVRLPSISNFIAWAQGLKIHEGGGCDDDKYAWSLDSISFPESWKRHSTDPTLIVSPIPNHKIITTFSFPTEIMSTNQKNQYMNGKWIAFSIMDPYFSMTYSVPIAFHFQWVSITFLFPDFENHVIGLELLFKQKLLFWIQRFGCLKSYTWKSRESYEFITNFLIRGSFKLS